jgi:DNA polymerase
VIVSNSGKGPQPQNLPRPTLSQEFIDAAIADIKRGCDLAWLEMMYGPGLVTVADIIRGCLVAAPGHRFVMADFSNIEGRVLAWLAGEDWKVEAFRRFDAGLGPDLYLVAAAGIYGVKVDTLNKKSPERQIGKVAELSMGFQGGVGAFQKMAELSGVEVSDEQADEIKTAWRAKHPATVQLWRDLESAALEACRFPGRVVPAAGGKIRYVWRDKFLWCRLPSVRVLSYASARLDEVETPWGEKRAGVTAMTPKGGAFFRRAIYGGGLTENVVQAIARDLMAEAMLRLEDAGYPVVLTVHDEVVAEVPDGFGSVEEFVELMTALPGWAEGCPVTAEGDENVRYRK